jgi:hypothetical protein
MPPPVIATSSLTPQWVFDHTTTTFKQVYGDTYEVALATMARGVAVPWAIDATSFGGTNGIPLMTADISCNPPPNSDPNFLDGQLLFAVANTYSCTISLTPLAGTDRRTQTETISFATPSGELTVTRAASMNSVLVNDENDGGITFTNTDPNPVNVTGLTFAVSYRYLTTATEPLILRLLTPDTDQQLSDYHLESLPQDPTLPYAQSGTVNASVVFTIPGSSQKMLPLRLLGVSKMLMSNTSPSITLTLTGLTTSRPSLKTILSNPTVAWSCDVALGTYDPNAADASEQCHG